METKLSRSMDKQTSTLKETIDLKFDGLGNQMLSLKEENASMKAKVDYLESCVELIANELNEVKSEVRGNKTDNNDLNQYTRKNTLRFTNIKETADETSNKSAELVVEEVNKVMPFVINICDIDIAHRLPNKKGKVKTIICKFVRRATTIQILANKKLFQGDKEADVANAKEDESIKSNVNAIRVYDDISPKNRDLLNKLWEHPLVNKAWIYNARLHFSTNRNDRIPVTIGEDITYQIREAEGKGQPTDGSNQWISTCYFP